MEVSFSGVMGALACFSAGSFGSSVGEVSKHGFRGLGFRVQARFRFWGFCFVLGFRASGFRILGFRVQY